ncbi:MAG: 2-oxo acid dehydrogenase subunit E2 [Planctomycetaceae bacterium]|jgi:pyruvate dehydrogenase E2 component (dihydrolipoamide acetyltransferase)|nr:2-oxo acid dehydrogenase subunit E2 [Planctomycetaceae bacterium]
MAQEIKLPEVSEGVESVDIGDILISVGDTVEAGQEIMELETDKAVVPFASPSAGTITKILVAAGDTVMIGQPILEIDADGGGAAPTPQKEEAPATAPAQEEPKAESKPAPTATPQPTEPTKAAAPATTPGPDTPPPPAGPATRRLARELGVDLHHVTGSGPHGRITIEDVQAYVKSRLKGSTSGGGGGIAEPSLPDFGKFGETERERLNKLSRTAAQNLTMAWNVIPHVTQHDQIDITETEKHRRQFVAKMKDGPKVTMTALAIKASVVALKEFPRFNASFDSQSGEIVFKKYYNIGVAVDTPNGLVVPVIRDCDKKSVLQIAGDVTDMAVRARDRKLDISEMQGATFTITNLGGIGGVAFTPIVNWPEVAILGMSRSQKTLAYVDGELSERLMLPLSLSYDHRVINGAEAARFVARLGRILSDPFQWLVES